VWLGLAPDASSKKKGRKSQRIAAIKGTRRVNDALVESEGSHPALNGPVGMNTYSNIIKLARVLGLDTKAEVKE
jgi:hypothetical protein